jgi:hypothetical protein
MNKRNNGNIHNCAKALKFSALAHHENMDRAKKTIIKEHIKKSNTYVDKVADTIPDMAVGKAVDMVSAVADMVSAAAGMVSVAAGMVSAVFDSPHTWAGLVTYGIDPKWI